MTTIPQGDSESPWSHQRVARWRQQQMQHMPNPSTALVLVYLCDHAFFRDSNPEDAPIGQVMQQASFQEAISDGTGCSRKTVYRSLRWLQENGFIYRGERPHGSRFHQADHRQSHEIAVLFKDQFEHLRERARNGQQILEISAHRPVAPARVERPVAEVIPLRLVQ